MHEADAAIVATKVAVVRGKTTALASVTCTIAAGKITGIIGPSGSGKTTLLRTIVGTQQLTGGSLQVLGLPAGSKQLRKQIGYVTQTPAVYDDLTVRQNLLYFAAMVGVSAAAVTQVIGVVGLQRQAAQLVSTLSGGQRARVSLAVALLGDPPLLVLDEPTVGLDPVLRKSLWELFGQLAAEGRTLLISSHVMDEAEQCQDLLLLRDGKVLRHSSKADLLASTKSHNVHDAFLRLAGGAP
jgi:ABC-2 type transport system ATP-binding protein